MLCVLVVDDEPRQRKIMANIIREFRKDYEVLEAKNGEEALSLCMERRIDIIFSDIRMPKMDGLSLIEHISKVSNTTKIVFISGYDDFTYAQKAMEYHAFSYILKPIEERRVLNIIVQIEDELHKQRKSQEEKDVMTKQLNKLLPFYFDYLMNKWIIGECSQSEIDEINGIFQSGDAGCVILSQVVQDNALGCTTQYTNEDINEIKFNLKMWIKEVLYPYGHTISFDLEKNSSTIVSILNSKDPPEYTRVLKDLQSLIKNLNKEYLLKVTIGVGAAIDDVFTSIKTGYESAEAALHCLFYLGVGRVISYAEIQESYTREINGGFPGEDDLKQFIHGQKTLSKQWIDSFMDSILGDSYLEPDILLDYLSSLMLNMNHSIQNIIPEEKFIELHQQIKNEFSFLPLFSLSELKKRLLSLLKCMADAVQIQKDNKNNIVLERCLHYIHSHLGKELSLEELASKYYFNPSYFSTLFKKYTGMHYTDYIIDLRLKNAHRLLLDSDKKIYIIAQEVGYRDVKYFNKIFKRRYGVTPDECRKFSNER